jgi:hypothetical protein
LSGGEGFGFLSLRPIEFVRRDSALFGEVKCLFFTAPEVGKETEANGGHYGDRTLHQTRSRFDRTRLVSSTRSARLGFVTGRWSGLTRASGQFFCAQKKCARPARPVPHVTGGFDHASRGAERSGVLIGRAARPVTCDRTRPVVEGAYWTLTGRWHCRVRSLPGACPVVASRARDAVQSARPVS